ncbi:energy-coupling factor ABC transporter ATP-binding protein [Shinella pollutisoli]|uniref:Energy-coupling factor ABC transporter ATP-binding protein n=1 Tax=Shinella pollutisoli TaxID=2250594 RepID=A0ABV7DCX8_9HYPH|nr:ABC transporter ATP-binding protein [Shinella pollutisoli]
MDIVFTAATVSYAGRVALHPLSLTLSERRIGVVGLNGSGKTTMARLINGLVKPSGGAVTVDGLDTVKDEEAARGKTGFIFQNPQHQMILPILAEDIAFGLKNRGLDKAEIAARTAAILERFGISHLARRRVHELSGGETQLGAIASVLVTGPKLLILDEPTNQLDLRNRALIARTIAGLPEQVLVISHDLPLLDGFDRVLVFHEGRLAADAPPAQAIRAYREIAAC